MDAHHTLHPQHGIVLAQPNCSAAVCVLFNRCVDRHERGRPVMLWPVELDASRNPGPKQSNKGRLDYILPVKKVVLVGLVEPRMNSPANFGKNHQLNEFVFKKDGSITCIHFLKSHAVDKWIGIDLAAASLINPFLEKHGIGVGVLDRIGWNRQAFFPAADLIGFKCFVHAVKTSLPMGSVSHSFSILASVFSWIIDRPGVVPPSSSRACASPRPRSSICSQVG